MISMDMLKEVCKAYSKDTGYRSHYMFAEKYALEIKDKGSSKGMGQYPVANDRLCMDLDDGDASLPSIEALLKEKGYKYSVWFSGGKGYHVYLYHDFIEDINLPYSHKCFVKSLDIACDFALFQAGRIVSLAGRRHPETKKQKKFLYGVAGKKVEIPIKIAPAKPTFDFNSEFDAEELVNGLYSLIDMAAKQPNLGNRHPSIWRTAKDLRRAGMTFEWIVEIMQEINSKWDEPKSTEEVEAAVEQAFR